MSLYILLHISVSIRETILESATFFQQTGEKNRFLYASALLSLSHFDNFFFFTALTHWQFLKLCSWKQWMFPISAWSVRHWERDGATCTPPSPTERGFRHGRRHGRRAAGSVRVARSRSCWRRAPYGSHASCRWAPWLRWSSCSRWSAGNVVWCLSDPLSDPRIRSDCQKEGRAVRANHSLCLGGQCCVYWNSVRVTNMCSNCYLAEQE